MDRRVVRTAALWFSLALLAPAQEIQRQTILRAIALNGINLHHGEWDSLAITPADTVSFAYACRCPPSQTPLLFRITLRRYEDGREQTRSIGVDSILYTQLLAGHYSFSVQAFAPVEGWYAEPVSFSFRVDTAAARWWKERRERLHRQTAPPPEPPQAPSTAAPTHAGNGWPWLLLLTATAGTLLLVLGLMLWYRTATRRRLRMEALQLPAPDPSQTDYDSLLAENGRLKAELQNLRGQISALEARSRHLQQENKALREQVERLSAKQEELLQLQEQKEALFAMVVHDIKNPALIIRSLVELLRSYDLSAQEQQEILNDIVETTSRIVKLSQEISRILILESKALQLDLQPVDIGTLIHTVCHRNQSVAERKSIALLQEVEPGLPLVTADPQRLEEVVDNLLSNAIKYSPHGATVTVRAYTREGRMHLEVEDTGLGMSEEDVRNAFQPGSRTRTQPTGGEPSSGLGLWIVKRLVEAHHGYVRIRSALGKGTTVYVELPLEQPTGVVSEPAP